MKLLWTEDAWDDYLYWLDNDGEMVRRVNRLIQDARRDPFRGKAAHPKIPAWRCVSHSWKRI